MIVSPDSSSVSHLGPPHQVQVRECTQSQPYKPMQAETRIITYPTQYPHIVASNYKILQRPTSPQPPPPPPPAVPASSQDYKKCPVMEPTVASSVKGEPELNIGRLLSDHVVDDVEEAEACIMQVNKLAIAHWNLIMEMYSAHRVVHVHTIDTALTILTLLDKRKFYVEQWLCAIECNMRFNNKLFNWGH